MLVVMIAVAIGIGAVLMIIVKVTSILASVIALGIVVITIRNLSGSELNTIESKF